MRTPKQAYDEALAVITQRIQAPNVVEHKSAYKLGLQVAIEQLRMSFYGVFDDVASTKEEPLMREDEGFYSFEAQAEVAQPPKHQQRHQEAQERGDFNPWQPTKEEVATCQCKESNHAGDCPYYRH